jgi:predicted small lipoprotein YifL
MLMVISISGMALSACGRRGDPELPPSAKVVSTDENGRPIKATGAPVVDRPFILDGLIQ